MTQLSLLHDDSKSKTIVRVPVGKLTISPFNPRQTRNDASIQKLADRIERNGFEITRALWAYANNGHYEVFAGGNRLEAVKRTLIDEVPVVLHDGYSDDEITRLADEDNENDEYHDSVPIVDVWMDYKRLKEMGWNGTRIAQAKRVSDGLVSRRLSYANFPASIHAFFTKENFGDGHALEISKILQCKDLSPWLTWEQAALEVIDAAVKKGGTAKNFADVVGVYNGFIAVAQECAKKLDDTWRGKFVELMANNKVRSKSGVTSAYAKIHDTIVIDAKMKEAAAAAAADAAEHERKRLEVEAELNRRVETQVSKIVHGDSRDCLPAAPNGIALLLTDPPYGQDFQSNRRVVKAKADKIANDTDDVAFDLLADVLRIAYPKMAMDSHVLIWSSWRYECEFRQIVSDAGFEIRGSLIWNKPNHGSGDLTGSFAPKHERIIHAVKGNPKLRNRPDDVLVGNKFTRSEHPTEKPWDLLQVLIEATTDEGDLVVDPFAGAGSSVIAAYKSSRDFWACELNAEWCQFARDLIYDNVRAEVGNG